MESKWLRRQRSCCLRDDTPETTFFAVSFASRGQLCCHLCVPERACVVSLLSAGDTVFVPRRQPVCVRDNLLMPRRQHFCLRCIQETTWARIGPKSQFVSQRTSQRLPPSVHSSPDRLREAFFRQCLKDVTVTPLYSYYRYNNSPLQVVRLY